jgi:pentatricopeptide repeat protein
MKRSRRLLCTALGALLAFAALTAARAETGFSQSLISGSLFRKMRAVQAMIRNGQYSDAQTQLGYLQGVTTNAYEAAAVHELTSDYYIARGDYTNALANLQPVVQQNVLPPGEQREAQLTLAKLMVANGQYQAGLDAVRGWMQGQENPPPDALITAAQAYAQLGQCRQAVPAAKRAIDATAEPPQEWYQLLISCLYDARDYAGAADALQGALARFPDQTQYWQQLGQAYTQAGDVSKALAVYALMYRQGLIHQPQDYLDLMSLYLQNNLPYQAAQVLQEGMQTGGVPANEANFMLLASAWQDAGEDERAVAALSEAAKAAKSGDAYLAQAQIFAGRHEWSAVLDTAKKALAKGSLRRPGRAWLLQGIAQVQSRQYDDGATSLREALKYDESRAQAEAWLRFLNTRGAG